MENYRFVQVRTRSNGFSKLTGSSDQFFPGHKLWTEPQSGSAAFRFEPRFRTERYHPYARCIAPTASSHLRPATVCTGKGAQGTWCVTHSKWCTRVAVTCDKVDKEHRGV